MFHDVVKHWHLIWLMTKREVASRYKGSLGGVGWSFVNPLIMLAVYTFVFGVIFQSRWNPESDDIMAFSLALFLGMIVHGVISECINTAPNLITTNVNYVKKVVFPLEILSWVSLLTAFFHMLISLCVWLIVAAFAFNALTWKLVYVPLILFPLVPFCLGFSWALSSLAVFLRDITQLATIFSLLLMFLSPVFYSVESLDEPYQSWIYYNPLTPIIVNLRTVLLLGETPSFYPLLFVLVIGSLFASAALWFFNKTKKGFADVL